MKRLIIRLLDRADDLTGHRRYGFCQWIALHPWWGDDNDEPAQAARRLEKEGLRSDY